MFTIIMNSDKSLSKRVETTLYQGERLVDVVKFLIPQFYEGIDLSDFEIYLSYIDPANIQRTEKLVLKDSNYKGSMLHYDLPVTSTLTMFAGEIKVHLTLKKSEQVMHSGDTTLKITPVDPCYHKIVILSGGSDEGGLGNNEGGNSSENGFPAIQF